MKLILEPLFPKLFYVIIYIYFMISFQQLIVYINTIVLRFIQFLVVILQSIADINSFLFKCIQFILLGIFLMIILGLLKWLCSKDNSYIILPFNITNTHNSQYQYDGKALAHLLTAELMSIRKIYSVHRNELNSDKGFLVKLKKHLYNKSKAWLIETSLISRGNVYSFGNFLMWVDQNYSCFEDNCLPITLYDEKLEVKNCLPITLYDEKLEVKMSGIGEIGYSGITKLKIDKLLIAIQHVWLFSASRNYLTGHLQIYGNTAHLVVYRGSHNIQAWQIAKNLNNKDQIFDLIKDLAFQISFDIYKDKNILPFDVNTVGSYSHLTKSFDFYIQYLDTQKISFLRESIRECKEACKFEFESSIMFSFLGYLSTVLCLYFYKRKNKTKALLELEKAIRYYKIAIKYVTDDFSGLPEILHHFACVLLIKYTWTEKKNKNECLYHAISTSKRATSIVNEKHPSFPYIHFVCGNALMFAFNDSYEKNYLIDAIDEYHKSLKYLSKYNNIYSILLNNLGEALIYKSKVLSNKNDFIENEDLNEAVKLFYKALEYLDNSFHRIPVLNNLSYGLKEQYCKTKDYSKLEQAKKFINQAIDLAPLEYPSMASLYKTLGSILRQDSKEKDEVDKEVLEAFNKAIEISPQDDGIYYNLACYYASLNLVNDAETNLRKAINISGSCFWQKHAKIDPDFKDCINSDRIKNILNDIKTND